MDFSKAIATTIDLPVQVCEQEKILNYAECKPLTLAQRDDFLSKCRHFPGDIFIINDHCFSIICHSDVEWVLVPLNQQASELYRYRYLIDASELHHRSLTIH